MNRSLTPARSKGFTPTVLHASVKGKTKSPVLVALSACTLFPSVAGPSLQPSGEATGSPAKGSRVAGDASGLLGNTSAEGSASNRDVLVRYKSVPVAASTSST